MQCSTIFNQQPPPRSWRLHEAATQGKLGVFHTGLDVMKHLPCYPCQFSIWFIHVFTSWNHRPSHVILTSNEAFPEDFLETNSGRRTKHWGTNMIQSDPIPASGYQIHLPLDLESDSRTSRTHWHMSVPVLLILSCKCLLKPRRQITRQCGNTARCLLRGPWHNAMELQPQVHPAACEI